MLEISHDRYLKITWSVAGVSIAALVSVVIWLTTIDSKASDAKDSVDRAQSTIREIDQRTIRIETIVNDLKESLKDK